MKKVTYRWFRGFGFILSCFFFAAAAGVFAQESSGDGSGARVYHAEGADFILTTGEQRYIHRPGSLGEAGLVLNSRDMIQTGADSFVEIQLIPGGTVIKAAENTSFVFNGPGRDGASMSFTLLYGRIRVIRGPGEGNRDVMVQAPNAAVFIRRGDIGMDYILRPGLSLTGSGVTTPLLRTFGFSGTADLVPLVIGERNGSAGGEAAFIRVSEGETLALEVFSGLSFTERKALERDIVEYWIRNDFKGTPPLKIPDTLSALASHRSLEPSEPANQIQYTLPDYSAIKKLRQVKNGGIAAGILFSIVGIGIQSFGAYQMRAGNNKDSARLLINTGYGPLGLGIVTLMMTLAVNSSNPAEYGAP